MLKSPLLEAVFNSGSVASKSDARRLIQQGGVKVNGQQVKDPNAELVIAERPVIRAGKLKWFRIVPA